jgi:hypothetical protein
MSLEGDWFDALQSEVRQAMATISPTSSRCDRNAWHSRLCLGAKDHSNLMDTVALGSSFDVVPFGKYNRTLDRPERYFGIPVRELLDCHMLAYRAAKAICDEPYRQ